MVIVLSRLENYFYRHTLNYLYVISRGVFWRQKTQARAAGSGDAIHVGFVGPAVGVELDFSGLAGAHVF